MKLYDRHGLLADVNVWCRMFHYGDVIMSTMVSQITNVFIVYSAICVGADRRKHQSSMSLVLMRGIHRWPMNSLHRGPVTWKMFSFDDVIMLMMKLWITSTIFANKQRNSVMDNGSHDIHHIAFNVWIKKMQYFQCISTGDAAVLHWPIYITASKDIHPRFSARKT